MWKFTIKQDGLKVASGFGDDKEFVFNECFNYVALYPEESFKKMTIEIKETDEKMFWEKLCEEAKNLGYILSYDEHYEMCDELSKNGLCFYENGKIKTDLGDVISENKTLDQMYQIMEALR